MSTRSLVYSHTSQALVDVVDLQYDFTFGVLKVPGAAAVLPAANAFLQALTPDVAKIILFKADTHFRKEYPHSQEAKAFPVIHCPFNEQGQELVVVHQDLAVPVAYMNKNEFDMWGKNQLKSRRLRFDTQQETQAYDNLFKVTARFNQLTPGTPLRSWYRAQGISKKTPVVLLGVASDYCVLDGLRGYILRGHPITVLTDLTAGIGGDAERSGSDLSGTITAVCKQHFALALKSGQLRLMDSAEYLMERKTSSRPLELA